MRMRNKSVPHQINISCSPVGYSLETMSSRRVPGRYPPVGTSLIADRIRERRGARGLTALDGALLHLPLVASG